MKTTRHELVKVHDHVQRMLQSVRAGAMIREDAPAGRAHLEQREHDHSLEFVDNLLAEKIVALDRAEVEV